MEAVTRSGASPARRREGGSTVEAASGDLDEESRRRSGGPDLAEQRSRSDVAVRLIGLALLCWGVASEVPLGLAGRGLAATVLLSVAGLAWLGWLVRPTRSVTLGCLAVLGAAGGALTPLAPFGLAFVGTAALAGSSTLELAPALAIAAAGPLALVASWLLVGESGELAVSAVAVSLAGLAIGAGRRRRVEAAAERANLAVAEERAALEHARAEVLAERNRLARELHDVLAHTLGALTVQLEALDAQLSLAPGAAAGIRDGVRRTKALAADGLAEARRAVQALREDSGPLVEQLASLCDRTAATFSASGSPGPVAPEAGLALYRVGQEALTNAAKHAPGAAVTMHLAFEEGRVNLTVHNGRSVTPPGALARTGAGYGLDGMAERVRLAGGAVSAGPDGEGWRVDAWVPR